jgi:hypothetical protein
LFLFALSHNNPSMAAEMADHHTAAPDKTETAPDDAFYSAATPPSGPPLDTARSALTASIAAGSAVPSGSIPLSPPIPSLVATAGDLASLLAGPRGPTKLRFTARPFVPAAVRREGGDFDLASSSIEDQSAKSEGQLPPVTAAKGGAPPLSPPRALSHGGPRKESVGNALRASELDARQRAVRRSQKGMAPLGPSLVPTDLASDTAPRPVAPMAPAPRLTSSTVTLPQLAPEELTGPAHETATEELTCTASETAFATASPNNNPKRQKRSRHPFLTIKCVHNVIGECELCTSACLLHGSPLRQTCFECANDRIEARLQARGDAIGSTPQRLPWVDRPLSGQEGPSNLRRRQIEESLPQEQMEEELRFQEPYLGLTTDMVENHIRNDLWDGATTTFLMAYVGRHSRLLPAPYPIHSGAGLESITNDMLRSALVTDGVRGVIDIVCRAGRARGRECVDALSFSATDAGYSPSEFGSPQRISTQMKDEHCASCLKECTRFISCDTSCARVSSASCAANLAAAPVGAGQCGRNRG